MSQFMPNNPQCRVAIRKRSRREIDPPNRQVGIGESGSIGTKSNPRLQKLVVPEYHKSHWLLGSCGLTEQPCACLRDARDESFLRLGAAYDDQVCCRS